MYSHRKACSRCIAAKMKCDQKRPCGRCTRRGEPEECLDIVRKKRVSTKHRTRNEIPLFVAPPELPKDPATHFKGKYPYLNPDGSGSFLPPVHEDAQRSSPFRATSSPPPPPSPSPPPSRSVPSSSPPPTTLRSSPSSSPPPFPTSPPASSALQYTPSPTTLSRTTSSPRFPPAPFFAQHKSPPHESQPSFTSPPSPPSSYFPTSRRSSPPLRERPFSSSSPSSYFASRRLSPQKSPPHEPSPSPSLSPPSLSPSSSSRFRAPAPSPSFFSTLPAAPRHRSPPHRDASPTPSPPSSPSSPSSPADFYPPLVHPSHPSHHSHHSHHHPSHPSHSSHSSHPFSAYNIPIISSTHGYAPPSPVGSNCGFSPSLYQNIPPEVHSQVPRAVFSIASLYVLDASRDFTRILDLCVTAQVIGRSIKSFLPSNAYPRFLGSMRYFCVQQTDHFQRLCVFESPKKVSKWVTVHIDVLELSFTMSILEIHDARPECLENLMMDKKVNSP
eukprot:Phypoly_transcript_05003.p1 GENE.Phypoly_transcript_05003~~Phypoly_transcript_05003.p1  ORF type:complete len:499 (+),score=137.17 Phypoly_transcript_05003:288-1784(+)